MRRKSFGHACHFLWFVLTACANWNSIQGAAELISPPPPNYHEVVAARIGPTYYEAIIPTEAEISAPFSGQSQLGASSQVCVRAPKESPKTGSSVVSVTFRAGEIVDVDYEFGYSTCRSAAYKPFPEMLRQYKRPAPGTKPPAVARPNSQNRQICYSGC